MFSHCSFFHEDKYVYCTGVLIYENLSEIKEGYNKMANLQEESDEELNYSTGLIPEVSDEDENSP